jgi:hypothetical protein
MHFLLLCYNRKENLAIIKHLKMVAGTRLLVGCVAVPGRYGYVPSGTSGVSVMQIHNEEGAKHSTVLMLHVYDGDLLL